MNEFAKLSDFISDQPLEPVRAGDGAARGDRLIDGVRLQSLIAHRDDRGHLIELLTAGPDLDEPIVHVYHVFAEPGSVRAWVYHRHQFDRLAFTAGTFKVVLFDLREDSATYGLLNELELGEHNPCRLTIPPFVVHGVMNVGDGMSSFINMPTRAYDRAAPDKSRLPNGHPGIPYTFPDPGAAPLG